MADDDLATWCEQALAEAGASGAGPRSSRESAKVLSLLATRRALAAARGQSYEPSADETAAEAELLPDAEVEACLDYHAAGPVPASSAQDDTAGKAALGSSEVCSTAGSSESPGPGTSANLALAGPRAMHPQMARAPASANPEGDSAPGPRRPDVDRLPWAAAAAAAVASRGCHAAVSALADIAGERRAGLGAGAWRYR